MPARNWIAAALVAVATPALGAGYYNMPTSWQQCLGVGFGPGYHAPMLLGPMMDTRIAAQPVLRLPAPLAPPTCGGFDAPSVWSDAPAPTHGMGMMHPVEAPFPAAATHYPPAAPVTTPIFRGPRLTGEAEVVPAPAPGVR